MNEENESQGDEIADLVCIYKLASGPSYADCAFLAQRYREEFGSSAEESDFWIMANKDSTTYRLLQWKNFLTGIWRAPSGWVYVSDVTFRGVHLFRDVFDLKKPPEDFPLPMLPEGVWGLDDRCVFVWGTRKPRPNADLEYPVFRFDGTTWHELPSPGYAVVAMHGLAPDFVYAVGFRGLVAQWDGAQWKRYPIPTGEVLSSVFVAGPDEMYACGHQGT